MVSDNKSLGTFRLDGIPAAPRGVPQVEVAFDIDANGIMNVTAKDKGTNKEQNIRIEASSGLSDDEVEKMVHDAQANAAEDKKKREAVDIKNQAEQQVHQTEKQLEEMGDKVSEESKTKVTEAVDKVKEVLQGEDSEAIKAANENLTEVWHAVASELYQQAAADGQAPGAEGAPGQEAPPSEGDADDSVVDAEFEVVDDEKK